MIKFLFIFIISFNLCAQVKYIDKDTPAPYNGYLFTVEKTKEVRKDLIEKDRLTEFNKVLQENIKIQETVISNQKVQVTELLSQNEKLVKEVDANASTSTFSKVLWFGLGVAASGFAVYGAAQLTK